MKKHNIKVKLYFLAIFSIILLPELSAEEWIYYPPNVLKPWQVQTLNIPPVELQLQKGNYIYLEDKSENFWGSIDISTIGEKPVEKLIETGNAKEFMSIREINLDEKNTLWNLHSEYNAETYTYIHKLYMYDGKKFVQKTDGLPLNESGYLNLADAGKFLKNEEGELYLIAKYELLKITAEDIISTQMFYWKDEDKETAKFPVKKIVGSFNLPFLWKNYLCFKHNSKDTLYMYDYKNPNSKDAKQYCWADLGIPATQTPKFIPYGDEILVECKISNNLPEVFYIFKDEQLKLIELDYYEETKAKGYFPFIWEIKIINQNELRVNMTTSVSEDSSYSEILYFDKNTGQLKEKYLMPLVPHSVSGEMVRFSRPSIFEAKNGNLYLTSETASGKDKANGILKFSRTNGSINESETGSSLLSKLHIFSLYPSVLINNEVTVDFYCEPKAYSQFSVDVSDILGQQIKDFNYSIESYNLTTGRGLMKLKFNSNLLCKGVKIISLRVNNAVCSKALVVID